MIYNHISKSVPLTNEVGYSNHAHGEAYSIQHYVIKFVNDLPQVGGFLWVSSTNKINKNDIAEILVKKGAIPNPMGSPFSFINRMVLRKLPLI
jgi:hypothetical protein